MIRSYSARMRSSRTLCGRQKKKKKRKKGKKKEQSRKSERVSSDTRETSLLIVSIIWD